MRTKVLVVAPQPFFTARGTPFSVYHRTRMAALLGARTDLLTYGEGEDADLGDVRIVRIWRLPFLGPVRIGPSFGKLVRDVLLVASTFALLVRHRYSVVHAHEEAAFFCRFFKPIFRFRLIYDMHSSLPQQLVNFEFSRSRLLIGLFERLERSALQAADVVITISPATASYAMARMPDPSRHVLIENSILDEVKLRNGNRQMDDARPSLPTDRRLVVYAGTFEPYQGIDLLVASFRGVLEAHPDSHLVLVGGNDDQVRHYQRLAEEQGLGGHATFTGHLSPKLARDVIRSASVVVSSRVSGTNTPLKIYELLASGIPFVATRIPSHTQVLDESVCTLVGLDPDSFAQGISEALSRGRHIEDKVRSARQLYLDRYSAESYFERLAKALTLAGIDVQVASSKGA